MNWFFLSLLKTKTKISTEHPKFNSRNINIDFQQYTTQPKPNSMAPKANISEVEKNCARIEKQTIIHIEIHMMVFASIFGFLEI